MSGPYTSDDDRLVEALRQLQNLNPPLDFWKELTEVQRNYARLADDAFCCVCGARGSHRCNNCQE